MRNEPSTWRTRLATLIADGPPAYPGDKWFCDDLEMLALPEVQRIVRQLGRALDLLSPVERLRWPGVWIAQRLERGQTLIRAERTARGWALVRR